MKEVESSERSERSVLTGGVQGSVLGPLVGSIGATPLAGVQGAEPLEVARFSGTFKCEEEPLERASAEYILKFYHNKNVANDPDFEGFLFSL